MNLAIQPERVITLKEITDLISVQHSKAMGKVKTLSKQESFGEVSETTTLNLNNVKVKTFLLTKKQAIAVGAKLNDALLMKVVDRVEEIEQSKSMATLPKKVMKEIKLALAGVVELDERVDMQHNRIQEVEIQTNSQDDRLIQLENNVRLTNQQEYELTQTHHKKVYQLAKQYGEDANDKKLVSKLHRQVWSIFKKHFMLPRFNELQANKFNDGIAFLQNIKLKDI